MCFYLYAIEYIKHIHISFNLILLTYIVCKFIIYINNIYINIILYEKIDVYISYKIPLNLIRLITTLQIILSLKYTCNSTVNESTI